MKENSTAILIASVLSGIVATTVIINAIIITAMWVIASFITASFYPLNFMEWPCEMRIVISIINAVYIVSYLCVISGNED